MYCVNRVIASEALESAKGLSMTAVPLRDLLDKPFQHLQMYVHVLEVRYLPFLRWHEWC